MTAEAYVHQAINSFNGDPPDTEFQRGYLAALLNVWVEGFDQDHDKQTRAAERLITPRRRKKVRGRK